MRLMQNNFKKIAAVIVTYYADQDILRSVVNSIIGQVATVIIVDNGSSNPWLSKLLRQKLDFDLILLESNLGIGSAQNIGIQRARDLSSDFVLLMDQDSVPSKNMVQLLLDTYQILVLSGKKISAIGPRFLDSESGRLSSHVAFGRFGTRRIDSSDGSNAVPVDFLISSGSLIPLHVLDNVGNMDGSLFIDHVDTEWILRAHAKGYTAFGHAHATMTHSIGENRLRFWYGRWREVPLHKTFRYYYVYRNAILLMKRGYISRHWKRIEIFRLLQMTIFLLFFHPARHTYLKFMLKGIKDGIQGRTGSFSPNPQD